MGVGGETTGSRSEKGVSMWLGGNVEKDWCGKKQELRLETAVIQDAASVCVCPPSMSKTCMPDSHM